MSKKIIVIFGTRPEAIKLAPVIQKLKSIPAKFETKVILTAQHKDLVAPILDYFSIRIDYNLDIMRVNQNLSHIATAVLKKIESVFIKEEPDLVMVQGDTTSAMSAALAAFFKKIPVAHVEAGLRTAFRYLPFPEEMNRRLITQLSNIHFAATAENKKNLIRENVLPENIFVTGNPIIDALKYILGSKKKATKDVLIKSLEKIDGNKKIVLLTAHRRENFGQPLQNIFGAVRQIIEENPDIQVVYPVHPNPSVRKTVKKHLPSIRRLHLLEPLDYISFVKLMNQSYFIMTDSGGIQEEAPALGKPVLVLRTTTEREELLESGCGKLVGVEKDKIIEEATLLLTDTKHYERMATKSYPFGRGNASEKIVKILQRF